MIAITELKANRQIAKEKTQYENQIKELKGHQM